ncbi:hypothetical protein FOL47_003768 [Perkinsus chesapeaki]|uniref:Inner centromere protein ARK-binding domain-containing protein n=1 Tax=Perkinsus chesapeaki TaxID=330153 RepID=A0A7J6MZL6_PERCH|nr:hypothetical protein FOL47_003768 [Perkinsus chesapeaki]
MSFNSQLRRESVRKVDLAALFGCLADAGDAGIAALQSELKSSMKEADGCLDDIVHQVPSWLESRGVAVPTKPTVMTAPLLNPPPPSVPGDSLCCSSMNDESEEDLSRGHATGGPSAMGNATASRPISRSPGDKLLSIGNHSVFNDQSSCSAAAVMTIGGADTQRSRVKDLASKFEAKKLSAAPHHMTRTNTTASMSASVKRQMNRGYFPDASPSVEDPPTPVWARGRKSIAEMMDGNEDNVSPIAGQKGSGMDLDVKRAVESLPSEYEVSKVFSTPIPPAGSGHHSDVGCDKPSHEDVGSGRRVLLSTTVSKNTARITITGGKVLLVAATHCILSQVKRLRSLDSPPRFDDQYPISEYDEDTDEHSEDARHKHIPAWSMKWQSMVLAQSSTDPDSIFGDRIPSCDIRQVFGDIVASGQLDPPNTQSFKDYIRINDKTGRRGSTGNWKFDELLDEEIYTYKQKMNQNIKAENVFVDCSPDAEVDGSVLDEESNICMP